jgi:hypothetical protein
MKSFFRQRSLNATMLRNDDNSLPNCTPSYLRRHNLNNLATTLKINRFFVKTKQLLSTHNNTVNPR